MLQIIEKSIEGIQGFDMNQSSRIFGLPVHLSVLVVVLIVLVVLILLVVLAVLIVVLVVLVILIVAHKLNPFLI